jgi:hypothetical protein
MTNLQGKMKKTLRGLYGSRTWVEYGFRQCKQESRYKIMVGKMPLIIFV